MWGTAFQIGVAANPKGKNVVETANRSGVEIIGT